MEDFRSKSYGGGGMHQIDGYYGASAAGAGPTSLGTTSIQDLRCYSASYASSVHPAHTQTGIADFKLKKGKSTNASSSKSWSFNDPELQRKKRVASYKVYTVEGKVKGSIKKSFRWLKDTYTRMVYGS